MPNDAMSLNRISLVLGMLNQRSQNESPWRLTYRPVDEQGAQRPLDSLTLCYENLVDFPFETVRPGALKWRMGADTVKFFFSSNAVEIRTPSYEFFTELYPFLRNASIRTIHLTMSF